MRVRTKLVLIGIVPVIVAAGLAALAYQVQASVNLLQTRSLQGDALVKSAYELHFLVRDYTRYLDLRRRQQLVRSFQEIDKQFEQVASLHKETEKKLLLDDFAFNLGKIREGFDSFELEARKDNLNHQYIDLLRQNMLLYLADLPAIAERVHELDHATIEGMERRQRTVGVGVAIAVLCMLLVASLTLAYRLSRSLEGLNTVVRAYGKGDRDVRAKEAGADELVELGKGFNEMADNLAAMTVSRDLLSVEIAERQRAEAEREMAKQQVDEAKERMFHMEKLSALGTLVGGVAHEINNPLMGLSSYITFAAEHATDTESREVLERANGEVERIGRLVKNMLVFSRIKPSGSDDQSNITATLKKVLALLQADYRRLEINCSIEVPDDIHVRCNEDSLQQILLNLLMNARDALATSLPPRKIAIEGRREGSYVVLSVSDSGPGVPEDKRSRIFDPFFTTKPPGQGTGLGLAVSRQAVDAAGGEIELDKGYGRGARFVVRFEAA